MTVLAVGVARSFGHPFSSWVSSKPWNDRLRFGFAPGSWVIRRTYGYRVQIGVLTMGSVRSLVPVWVPLTMRIGRSVPCAAALDAAVAMTDAASKSRRIIAPNLRLSMIQSENR